MNNKVKHVLVLLFVVSFLLLIMGTVSANNGNLTETIEASYELDNGLSIDDNVMSNPENDVSNQLTISNIEETNDTPQSIGENSNDSNSDNVVSNIEDTAINTQDGETTLGDAYFTFEQTPRTPISLLGDEVLFDYFVKYQGPGRLNSEYIIVDVHFSEAEMNYNGFIANPNKEAPWLGQEWWGENCYQVDHQGDTIYVKYKPPVAFEEGYCFNFTLNFTTKVNGVVGTGAHIDNTYYWAINATEAVQKLNLTKVASKSRANYGDDIYFDVCLENNKLKSYFGDYRKILLIEDYYPEGLVYVDYKINPDKNGILPDENKISIGQVTNGHVDITYDTRDGWAPNSFLNVTLHFRANKNGILCNHVRTWWQDGTEFWAEASVCVGEPNLTLNKTVLTKEVALGEDVYFEIYCENTGDIPYWDHYQYPGWLLIDDFNQEGLEYQGDFVVNPDKDGNVAKNVTIEQLDDGNHLRIVYFINDNWNPGSSLNVTIHYKAVKMGKIANNVTVYWKWKDWGPLRSHEVIELWDDDTLTVGNVNFTLEKISNYKNVEIGDEVVFTITYTNTGHRDLTGVYIKDNEYTQGLELSDYSDKELWDFDGVDTWYYKGILPQRESAVLELTFKTTSTGFKENTAIAGHNITDDTLNSTDNVTVEDKITAEDDVEPDDEPEPEPDENLEPDENIDSEPKKDLTPEPEPKENPTPEPKEDPTPENPKNPETPEKTSEETSEPHNSKTIDSRASGNPICVLLLSLIAICVVPIRFKK